MIPQHDRAEPVGNPFSTRYVRPGRLPPLDAEGRPIDIAMLCETLAVLGGSAAVVGPHGSGKTTLLVWLANALEAGGSRIERVRFRGLRDVVSLARAIWRTAEGGTVCVDCWERLGWPGNGLARLAARLFGARLLVTAHRVGPLPTLCTCATSAKLLEAIVARLPIDSPLLPGDVDEAFRRARGDVREALFLLYDRCEELARASRGGVAVTA